MAMRHCGIQSKCMLLTMSEFYNLCITKRIGVDEKTSELFECFYDNNNIPKDFDEIEIDDLLEISYNINYAYLTMQTDGQFIKYDENGYGESEYYKDEDLLLIELEKDTLFDNYNNFDEIYEEIIEDFKEVGIIINKDYVKEHFGMFEGGYYA